MLQGETALVTGSISGIGLGTACSLTAQGVNIIMNGFGDVGVPKAQTAVVGKDAIRVEYHGADMNKSAEIEATFAHVDAEFSGVDILVNNAGIQYVANTEDFPTERWDAITATNLTLVFRTTRPAVPGMKRKNWGRIINVAPVHGLMTSAQELAHVAAKHGTVDSTKSVTLETAQTGITSNAICPGWVLMPLAQRQIDVHAEKDGLPALEAEIGLLMEKQPLREFVTFDQLSVLAVFLCSDAAERVHGAAWNMDGGWIAQ